MKSRIYLLLWLFLMSLMWLAGRLQAAEFLLIGTILAEAVLAAEAGVNAGKLSFDFDVGGSQNGQKQAIIKINSNYKGWLPIRFLLKIEIENKLTGDKEYSSVDLLLAKGKHQQQIVLSSQYAGKLQTTIRKAYVADAFGVISFEMPRHRDRQSTCLLLPKNTALPQFLEASMQYDRDSDVYAVDRVGQDLSQTYELRDYRIGDSFKSVHWKRSSRNAESDNLIVREGSYPIGYRLLLLLENGYEQGKKAIESACGLLIAISEDLTDKGILHHIGFWDQQTQSIKVLRIQDTDDLMQALGGILGATLEERKKTIREKYLENCESEQFLQMIVVDDETATTYSL